ncbi:MAG TPA: hypothetical protein VLA04_01465 [Verrucomicrobiae bacterium]|nr:hypothetical protein [Verrucomicrobiae bacterium]
MGGKDETPVESRLQQILLNAGARFFDANNTVLAKPVVGISAIGGISVVFDENTPAGHIALATEPGAYLTPSNLAQLLRQGMGTNAMPTYMNPSGKSADAMYDVNVEHHGVPSVAHAVLLGFSVLGLSQKAEMEFDTQRDLVHLARVTSARTHAMNEPPMVALAPENTELIIEVRNTIASLLKQAVRPEAMEEKDWREERNGLWPTSRATILGLNGTVKNFSKLIAAIQDPGKESEYRRLLGLINTSLHGLFPELFRSNQELGHTHPAHWNVPAN